MFIDNACGRLPKSALDIADTTYRYFIIGKQRLSQELNLVKMVKQIRYNKIMSLEYQTSEIDKLKLHDLCVIEVDDDDLRKK